MWTHTIQLGFTSTEGICAHHHHRDMVQERNALLAAIKSCGELKDLEEARRIHAHILSKEIYPKDLYVSTVLLRVYFKCGAIREAQKVFEDLPRRNLGTWNSLIVGYVRQGLSGEALSCFSRMREEPDISPDALTFSCILKACANTGSLEIGEEIHTMIREQCLLGKDMVLGTTLVDMYAKCGLLGKAQEVFDELPVQDVVAWSALISGYTQHGLAEKALACFRSMIIEGISPNVVTFTCILKACGSIGSLDMGEEIHAEVKKQKLLEKDVMLGNTLVDMYAKCGRLVKARDVFNELPIQNVVSWNALIAGYGQLGQAKSIRYFLNKMVAQGIMADSVTFLGLLSTCSHAGLVEEGQIVVKYMHDVGRLTPTLEHYTCMVDLFSRAGHFYKAIALVEEMRVSDRLPLLLALLSACHKCANVELGKWAFEQSVQLDANCSAAYIGMANIYAAAGMQAQAFKNLESRF